MDKAQNIMIAKKALGSNDELKAPVVVFVPTIAGSDREMLLKDNQENPLPIFGYAVGPDISNETLKKGISDVVTDLAGRKGDHALSQWVIFPDGSDISFGQVDAKLLAGFGNLEGYIERVKNRTSTITPEHETREDYLESLRTGSPAMRFG